MNIEELGKELQSLSELLNQQKEQVASIKAAADKTLEEIQESHNDEERKIKEVRGLGEQRRKELKAKAEALMKQSEAMAFGAQALESAVTVATESFKLANERLAKGDVEDALKSSSTLEEAAEMLGLGETEEEEAEEALTGT